MSLKAFHLVFISVSAVLAAFCAAWAVAQYRADHDLIYVAAAAAAVLSVAGLAVYGAAFQRKVRDL